MSVYRPKNSRFYIFDFTLGGYRFSGSTRCDDARDAEAFEAQRRQEAERVVEQAERAGRQPITIEVACARWFAEHGQHLAERGLKKQLDWLIEQLGPSTPLHAITDDTVARLVALRRQDVKRSGIDERGRQLHRPIKARTVNNTVTVLLRNIVRRARDHWKATLIHEPVWRRHMLKETRRGIREISTQEEQRLADTERPDYAKVRRLAIITGLRRREVLLTWPQVDLEQQICRIIGKGGVPAIVPLSLEACAIIRSCIGHHKLQVFTFVAQRTRVEPKTKTRFVRGQRYPITYFGLGSAKRRSWKEAGVDARWHDTRHTAAMRTLRTTGNLKLTQKLLRHSDISTTAKSYTDALVDDVRAAMEATAEKFELPALPPAEKKEG